MALRGIKLNLECAFTGSNVASLILVERDPSVVEAVGNPKADARVIGENESSLGGKVLAVLGLATPYLSKYSDMFAQTMLIFL